MPNLSDTICAPATPPGTGGIGVFRVSGPDAFGVADRVLRQRNATSAYRGHTLHRAEVIDATTSDVIDDVLVAVFHAPASYTGEDTVEISAHGGPLPMRRVLAALLAAGARMAEPGEFTMRAFLGGKMDLVQAEAVCDIIAAQTDEAHRAARSQQAGQLSKSIHAIREILLGVLARIEASIDFPEDVGELNTAICKSSLLEARTNIEALLATADRGILFREGAKVVLAGKPNVGKSSLMNALLRTSRAIVTDIPGTTRDLIEETLNISGIPVRLTDTAGIRETDDLVEKLGVERTEASIESADLVLAVVDSSQPLAVEDHLLIESLAARPHLVVANKADQSRADFHAPYFAPDAPIAVSALTGEGIDKLEAAIADTLLSGETAATDQAVVTHARHREALRLADSRTREALATLAAAMPPDFLAIDVRGAITALEDITGRSTPDDIINEIFTRFCIGK